MSVRLCVSACGAPSRRVLRTVSERDRAMAQVKQWIVERTAAVDGYISLFNDLGSFLGLYLLT